MRRTSTEVGRGPGHPFGPEHVSSATSSHSVVYWVSGPFPGPTPRPAGTAARPASVFRTWQKRRNGLDPPSVAQPPKWPGQPTRPVSPVLDCAATYRPSARCQARCGQLLNSHLTMSGCTSPLIPPPQRSRIRAVAGHRGARCAAARTGACARSRPGPYAPRRCPPGPGRPARRRSRRNRAARRREHCVFLGSAALFERPAAAAPARGGAAIAAGRTPDGPARRRKAGLQVVGRVQPSGKRDA